MTKKSRSLLTANKKTHENQSGKKIRQKVVWHFVDYASESASQSLTHTTTLTSYKQKPTVFEPGCKKRAKKVMKIQHIAKNRSELKFKQ